MVINQLLHANQGFTILAAMHDKASPSAQALRQKSSNIKIVQGPFNQSFFSKEAVVLCLLLLKWTRTLVNDEWNMDISFVMVEQA